MNEIYALLWSKKSNGFHIEPLSRAAESGMQFFRQNTSNDYLVIATGSEDEMDAKANELRPLIYERHEAQLLHGSDSEDWTA